MTTFLKPKKKQKVKVKADKRRTEFHYLLASVEDGLNSTSINPPSAYDFVELVARNYVRHEGKLLDLMYAYDAGDRDSTLGYLYIGKWNGGRV